MQVVTTAHTLSVVDAQTISEIFKCNTEKTLIWNGYKPDGKKNQYWLPKQINWVAHITGALKQGGRLNRGGKANCAVVDVDKDITAENFCREAYKIDPLIIPFKSPSGRWHAWKFYHSDKPVDEVIKEDVKCVTSIAFENIVPLALMSPSTVNVFGASTVNPIPSLLFDQYKFVFATLTPSSKYGI